jgi:hypothetical protein
MMALVTMDDGQRGTSVTTLTVEDEMLRAALIAMEEVTVKT